MARAGEVLDPTVLTIGFARRFATYKRATLFLRDVDRIKRILLDYHPDRLKSGHLTPRKHTVQFVIAGKAHPKDGPGKELIRDITHFIREEGMWNHIVFIPDYDIHVSRLLVAGCDVWLNTPRRPREASGTSGMKAAMNGLPNLSVLDGWWDEADYVRTGWPIGHGEDYEDTKYQDDLEANALYELFEQSVVPLFYERDTEDVPRRWVAKMKDAIRLNCPLFNTARMVRDYALRSYFPASDRHRAMIANHYAAAKELAHWKTKLFDRWYQIQIEHIDATEPHDVQVNQTIRVKAQINLAGLNPQDVRVELYQGPLDDKGHIANGTAVVMEHQGQNPDGRCIYTADVVYNSSGLHGLSLRVLPHHEYLSSPYEPRLILWAK